MKIKIKFSRSKKQKLKKKYVEKCILAWQLSNSIYQLRTLEI